MEKTIKYSGGTFNLRASAAVLIVYREQFDIEYTEDFNKAMESTMPNFKKYALFQRLFIFHSIITL